MPTRIKRTGKFNPVESFRQHLVLKKEAASITARSEKLKKDLKSFIPGSSATYVNENGSKFFDLPATLEVAGVEYKGMELRRSVPTKFDEDEATKILKKKGVYEEALSTYIDQDKVYRLLAQEKITDKDLDKMFVEGEEAFAFWPVKGEVL